MFERPAKGPGSTWLVDEYHFLVQPIVASRGPTLSLSIGQRRDLKLIENATFHFGVVSNPCYPAKDVEQYTL